MRPLGAEGLLLLQRLASAPIAGRCRRHRRQRNAFTLEGRRQAAVVHRGHLAYLGGARWTTGKVTPSNVFANPTINGYRRFPDEFARTGSRGVVHGSIMRRPAARAGSKVNGSGQPDREPRRRTFRESLSLARALSQIPSRASTASDNKGDPGTPETDPLRARPSLRCRRQYRARQPRCARPRWS